jgi:hypothetical protein
MLPPTTLEAAEKRTTTQLGLVPPCVKLNDAPAIGTKVVELLLKVPVVVTRIFIFVGSHVVAAIAGVTACVAADDINKPAHSSGPMKRNDMRMISLVRFQRT